MTAARANLTSHRVGVDFDSATGSPDRMLAEKDPVAVALFEKYKGARMPNVGLGPTDVSDIVTYLEKRSAAHVGLGKTHDHSAHAH